MVWGQNINVTSFFWNSLITDTKVKYQGQSFSDKVHDMNKPILIGATILALFVVSSLLPLAAAQYIGVGGGGNPTLEEQLKLAQAKVKRAQENPHSGSGTPYLDFQGVIGGSIVAGAVFGGIAIAFVVRSRSGRFAK